MFDVLWFLLCYRPVLLEVNRKTGLDEGVLYLVLSPLVNSIPVFEIYSYKRRLTGQECVMPGVVSSSPSHASVSKSALLKKKRLKSESVCLCRDCIYILFGFSDIDLSL